MFFCFPGDIRRLFGIYLKKGHAAAFATDCDLPAAREMIQSIGMQVDVFSFFKLILRKNFIYLFKHRFASVGSLKSFVAHTLDNVHGLPGLQETGS